MRIVSDTIPETDRKTQHTLAGAANEGVGGNVEHRAVCRVGAVWGTQTEAEVDEGSNVWNDKNGRKERDTQKENPYQKQITKHKVSTNKTKNQNSIESIAKWQS